MCSGVLRVISFHSLSDRVYYKGERKKKKKKKKKKQFIDALCCLYSTYTISSLPQFGLHLFSTLSLGVYGGTMLSLKKYLFTKNLFLSIRILGDDSSKTSSVFLVMTHCMYMYLYV